MKLTSGLFKLAYMPLCRAYARNVLGDKPADPVMRFLCGLAFWKVYHFWPKFVHPRRFSEKLWNRMLYDRNPQLTMLSDKLRVRDYVASKVGSESLIPLLWSGEKAEEIPFEKLPLKFVIKTNHGCGYNIIVKDKTKLDRQKATQQLKKWLGENFCEDKYLGTEWGYKNIKPSIIIEAFLDNDDGKAPADYKFYCFSGRVEVLSIHINRYEEDHKSRAFNRNFEPHNFSSGFKQHNKQYNDEWQRPPNYGTMVQLAESLAEDFDFMRVDLYNVKNKIYFGEFTPYPGGIASLPWFDAAKHDYVLGKKWKSK